MAGSPAGGAAGFVVVVAGGLVCVDPLLVSGGFGRFVMSDGSDSVFAPAFAPEFTSTPANEAGCAFELE